MTTNDEMIVPPDVVYVTYIKATPQRVWDALTRGEDTKRYFFGFRIESEWRAGAHWALYGDEGEVLECDPPRRLKISWKVVAFEDARELPPAYIAYDIKPLGETVRLTMTQHQPKPIPRKYYEGGKQGWPMILSSLKSLLETGVPLVIQTRGNRDEPHSYQTSGGENQSADPCAGGGVLQRLHRSGHHYKLLVHARQR